MLATYAQVAPSTECIQLWVAVFDTATPPLPSIDIDGTPVASQVVDAMAAIRDGIMDGAGQPLNHRTVLRITGLQPDTAYRVTVRAGPDERTFDTRTLPARLPRQMDGWFNIFLCSCYYQPEDASGTLTNVINKLKTRPNLTLMMGDQIYGDLPLDVDLPGGQSMKGLLGNKYIRNFASRALASGGLTRVLQMAPAMCVADDHEYWNNYPFAQAQLPNTWTTSQRDNWKAAAKCLYEDYQLGGGIQPGFARRIDIEPLRMLVMDLRSERDETFFSLMSQQARQALDDWKADLLEDRVNGKPAFGLLSSGQALFAKPTTEDKRKRQDAEMANWEEFDTLIVRALEQLSDAGVPIIYVTGDVHWGRVAQALDRRRGDRKAMIYEVIASPSTLIRVPVLDRSKEAWNGLKGILGRGKRWPRHSLPDPVPAKLGNTTRYELICQTQNKGDLGFRQQGDQVAILSLCASGGGVDFKVTYFEVSSEPTGANPTPTPNYSMRNL